MPPWFIEKNVGIQDSRDDISLSEEEIATLAAWVDAGAPRGNPADMPEPLRFASADEWSIGEPDLIVDTSSITLAGDAPDWWGTLDPVPTGQTVDRHVEALQIKEVSDVQGGIGGRFTKSDAMRTTLSPRLVVCSRPATRCSSTQSTCMPTVKTRARISELDSNSIPATTSQNGSSAG